jgi:hypothetical protein
MNMHTETENQEYLARQSRGRLMLISMLIFFVTPIAVVIAMYKLDWRPQGASVGELVIPPRLLNMNQALLLNDGKPLPANIWKDKWSMLYVAGDCDETCHGKLHDMRQLHVSLYKEIPRMQRVLVTTSQDVAAIQEAYPELLIVNQPKVEISALSAQFQINETPAMSANRIYLIDPLGNLMMSFAPTTDAALIRKDITRLMKYSWAG